MRIEKRTNRIIKQSVSLRADHDTLLAKDVIASALLTAGAIRSLTRRRIVLGHDQHLLSRAMKGNA